MINTIQTIGQSSKGFIYCFIGALTALAAFGMGGQKSGKSGVITFLQEQPFGKFLLWVLAVGIICYALWRFYKAIADPKSKGDDPSGVGKRFGYFISGLLYLFFGISVFMTTMSSGSGGGSSKQHFADQLMDKSYGPTLLAIIGVIIFGVGLYQIYKGYSGKYLEELNVSQSSQRKLIEKTGKFGFMARGVVFGILGYFVLRAGITENAEMVRGTQGAFSFLQQLSYGWLLMGIIAVGLLGYGIFMLFVAKHSKVQT